MSNYKLTIVKSNNTSVDIPIAIPSTNGTYNLSFTNEQGQTVDAGNFVVGSTQKTYRLTLGLSNGNSLTAGTFTTMSQGSGAVSFATDEWSVVQAEAQRIALAGSAADSPYNVGDERTVTLSTNEQIKLAIMGFNHDDLTTPYANGATKAGITLGMCDSLATTAVMNTAHTNAGGWGSSEMRTSMATYLSQLPSDLQAVVSPANKLTSEGNMSSTITTSSDSLWLFSLEEVHGTIYKDSNHNTQFTFNGEGTQYAYFSQAPIPSGFPPMTSGDTTGTFVGTWGSYRTRLNNNLGTTAPYFYNDNSYKGLGIAPTRGSHWWLRSPQRSSMGHFVKLHLQGNSVDDYAGNMNGVSYGLCI